VKRETERVGIFGAGLGTATVEAEGDCHAVFCLTEGDEIDRPPRRNRGGSLSGATAKAETVVEWILGIGLSQSWPMKKGRLTGKANQK